MIEIKQTYTATCDCCGIAVHADTNDEIVKAVEAWHTEGTSLRCPLCLLEEKPLVRCSSCGTILWAASEHLLFKKIREARWTSLPGKLFICPPCKRSHTIEIEHIGDWLIYLHSTLRYTIAEVDTPIGEELFLVVETGDRYSLLDEAIKACEARILAPKKGGPAQCTDPA